MTAPSLAPGSRHPVRIRAPRFDYADVPAHWMGGHPVATHVFNGLNLVFPDGERFFIEAVRDHLDGLEDEGLRTQVRGFFGQEGRHAHEHERYFEALESQGYEIRPFLRRFERFMELSTRWLPKSLRLSMTAGAEHYTATLGRFAFDDPMVDQAHPEMKRLILWHATEEVEHKAVAYDVLQATHPSYLLRVVGFTFATLSLFGWTIAGTRMLMRQDVAQGRVEPDAQKRAYGDLREYRRRDASRLWASVRRYLRRDFHPNEVDDLARAHAKLAEIGLGEAA